MCYIYDNAVGMYTFCIYYMYVVKVPVTSTTFKINDLQILPLPILLLLIKFD